MDREKNWEQEDSEADYSGYSEKQTDLDIEMKAGEWQNLSRFKTYQQRSRQGKIIATHQAVSNRLNQLEQLFYKLARNNPQKSTAMLDEIKKLRLIQDILLQCIAWASESKTDAAVDRSLEAHREKIPQEVWDLID
jgi:hypothetical protein